MPFICSICGEEATQICARCTKDVCGNHLCEKCLKCSDCCECEVALHEPAPAAPVARHAADTQPEPEEPAAAAQLHSSEPDSETPELS